MARRDSDKALWVKFETVDKLNEARSYGAVITDNENKVVQTIEGSGRPEFDNVPYIEIAVPGDKFNVVRRPVAFCFGPARFDDAKAVAAPCRKPDRPEDCDVHRFADEWARYKAGEQEQTEGIPLKMWAAIDPASVKELAHFNVFTVEQLAAVPDSAAGARFFAHRERAKKYLEDAEKASRVANVRAELDKRDARLKELEEQNAKMQEQLSQLVATKAPAGGKEKSR